MSTTTANLKLIKPEVTDNVSPQAFNDNFDKIDSEITGLKKDYVVAQGTQGVWTYRRWNSGIAECWIEEYTIASVSMTSPYANGNMYTGSITGPGNYPFTFKNAPLVVPTFSNRGSTGGIGYSFPIWAQPNGTTSKCPDFQGIDQTKGTLKNMKLAVYVKGTWK